MFSIHNDVVDAAKELNLKIVELPEGERENIRNSVAHKFAAGSVHWLWEKLNSATSIRNGDAWRWIDDFIKGEPILLFFNFGDDKSMFLLYDYKHIVDLLGETSGFEFYITNPKNEFLICFNHHDYLIASGTAESWLAEIKLSRNNQ